ncbi:MAG: hypothetical protein ACFE0Q_11425 [Anaerolineae bacterium]
MSVITHVRLEHDLHEIIFTEASHSAIDQFLGLLEQLYQRANYNKLYVVLDLRDSGMLPLRYLTKSVRYLFDKYPEQQFATLALVLEDVQMLNVTRALLNTIMHRETVQYFTRQDKARLWLQIEKRRRSG